MMKLEYKTDMPVTEAGKLTSPQIVYLCIIQPNFTCIWFIECSKNMQ